MFKNLLVLLLLTILNYGYSQNKQQNNFKKDTLTTLVGLSENLCDTYYNGEVQVNSLHENGKEIGTSIWLSRKSQKIKSKYFAWSVRNKSVYQRYTEWRNTEKKQIILETNGGYIGHQMTFSQYRTIGRGLTVDNGVLVSNRYLNNKTDALVIVYANGEITVSKDGDLYLEDLSRKKIDLKNILDRLEFIKWAKKNKVSVFQTDLLAHKGENMVDLQTSSSKRSRRKFLAIIKNEKGELYHSFFMLQKKSHSVYKATQLVLDYLQSKNYTTLSLINTAGSYNNYNVLNGGDEIVNCEDSHMFTGSLEILEDVVDLISYYYEE